MSSFASSQSLGEVTSEAFNTFSSRPALWINGRTLTYNELGTLAKTIAAHALTHPAVTRRLAVLADRNEIAYAGILGALFAGMAYVPLNPRFSPVRILDILQQADADIVICDARCATILASIQTSLPSRLAILVVEPQNAAWLSALGSASKALPVSREDTLYIMFTSGTTGRPKGVPVSHENALSFLDNIRERIIPQADDRFLQLLDLSFDPSLNDLFSCWSVGATLYSAPEGMATMAERFVRDFQITQFSSAASTAALLLAQGRLAPGSLPSLRQTIFGGEALPVSVATAWRKAAPQSAVRNHYGPTEATVAITECVWQDAWEGEVSGTVPIGRVFKGQSITLVDDALKPVSLGAVGELVVSGTQVTKGYLNNPQATQDRFVTLPGAKGVWYRTGDLVTEDPRYGFRYCGRADQQLKVRGFRVEGQEVESHVRAASGSDLVAVIGWPKNQDGLVEGLVAFVVSPKHTEQEIVAACKKRMPDYMVPARIIPVGELPLTANGKIDYAALTQSIN